MSSCQEVLPQNQAIKIYFSYEKNFSVTSLSNNNGEKKKERNNANQAIL